MQQFTAYFDIREIQYYFILHEESGKVHIACVCASNKNSEWKVNLQMQLHISKVPVNQAMLFYLT